MLFNLPLQEEKGVGEPLVDVTAIIEVSYALFEFLAFP